MTIPINTIITTAILVSAQHRKKSSHGKEQKLRKTIVMIMTMTITVTTTVTLPAEE